MNSAASVLLHIALLCSSFASLGGTKDEKRANELVEEGKRLYQLEMAAWIGTDLFLAHYENQENIGGYFSYPVGDSVRCVFFHSKESRTLIGSITFDSSFHPDLAALNLSTRPFNKEETELFTMRNKVLSMLREDSFFQHYENTSLNLIPLIHNGNKRVYVLTAPQSSGVVIFGNDYLITFDKKNEVVSKRALHQNLIPIEYGQAESETAIHTHTEETGDFITATDVCTLMLYAKYANWSTHNVVTPTYLNIWDCETNTLALMSMKVLEKIEKDQRKRNGKAD